MDTRSIEQWIVAIFLIGAGFCFPAFAHLTPIIYGRDFNLPLLDPSGPGSVMTEAIIDVTDHFVASDLDVRIDITHTRVFDLQLILQGPTGAWACLNKYEFAEFFDGENYTNTVFDDEAELSIEDANTPFTGRFKPEPGYLLGVFDGFDVYGTWRLQIYDMWPSDSGTLNRLELIFNAPEPATAVLLIFGMGFTSLLKTRPNH
jgi:hypothetical protein